jgi:cytochrome c oxidase subunit III
MREPAGLAEPFPDLASQRLGVRLGVWAFLTTELLLFGGILCGYALYRVGEPALFAAASAHLDLALASINTAVLLTSSFTMAAAHAAARAGRWPVCRALLLLTAALGLAFLTLKGVEYHHEWREQLLPLHGLRFEYPGPEGARAQLFFNLYLLGTGLHAIHLAAGIGLVAALAWQTRHRRPVARLGHRVVATGLYWHFVDVVWIFLFPLFYLV